MKKVQVSISRCSRTYKDTSSAAHGTMMWRQIFWRMKTSFVATPTCHIYSFPPFGIQRTLPTLQWHQDLLIECWTATGLVLCEIVMHRYVPFILACMHFRFFLNSLQHEQTPGPYGAQMYFSAHQTPNLRLPMACFVSDLVKNKKLSPSYHHCFATARGL